MLALILIIFGFVFLLMAAFTVPPWPTPRFSWGWLGLAVIVFAVQLLPKIQAGG